ncbi:phage tail protein [Pseudoalteromonas sp. Of7M-16]|uniref:phage tail protein n=1 Tax=Pseudoalteromonas sp. Of7M-16 TaxID=2917756 RepID=UPI001EF3E503|nr:phage tail protein [Pseudoalteromonas sp. Of7M-16]MCG7551578.1 phage tail protein [Pseudoalteromonas sp. Of7M-16]
MPEIASFVHNGISVERHHAPPPMGPLGGIVLGLVGTAPDADASLPKNSPIRIASFGDAAKLDTTGAERGTLWRTCYEIFRLVSVPIYAVIVDEGVDVGASTNNVVGGIDSATGQRTGIESLADCMETPTHICAPGFNTKPVADALAAMGKRLFAVPVGDGPNTNDQAAVDYSSSLGGEGTGYGAFYLLDPQVSVYSQAAKGNVYFSAAAIALSCFARVNAWESPAKGGMGALISGTSRNIDYSIMDKSTNGGLLNKHGVSYFARTSMGGFSLVGNRTVTGRFVSQVGLEYAIIRKLAKTAQRAMARNLSKSFMDQEITKLNVWLKSLQADETIIGAQIYLHPTLNNVDNYRNGEWHIAIKYHGYAPNEHMVYHLIEDTGIVEAFLEEVL